MATGAAGAVANTTDELYLIDLSASSAGFSRCSYLGFARLLACANNTTATRGVLFNDGVAEFATRFVPVVVARSISILAILGVSIVLVSCAQLLAGQPSALAR